TDYTGAIIQTAPSNSSNWMSMLNMSMSHSYSMNFGSVGGQFQNLNAYTNHLYFDLSDNLDAYVDVSFLHSPFGNSFMTNQQNSLGGRILIDRAQLDYQISENSRLSIQFSQRPSYSPFGHYPGSMYGRNYFGY
ncbi:MAG: hypothetical protein WD355_10450, partial [Balneolaceae bacterium]